ncbi:MAG: GGDEF domain-containing protein [Ruminococcaceae bacterium]|nr:GGDEF domain-containing protein [Oscillospiraceae bacterium]
MDFARIRRFTYIINSVILFLVIALAGFFFLCKAPILIWFSIPTLLVYILGYVLISKDRLDIYVRLVYFWITFYMCLCTFCLGYKIGFHLYCFSMIPIIFYTEYMADKLGRTKVNAFVASSIIAICYLLSTGYTAFKGPIYPVDNSIAGAFWTFNSVIVIAFLVFYSRLMLSLIGDYENKLKDAALIDKLTGLYNRHYMMEKLEKTVNDSGPKFVTMIDIDDFKKINDRYGHNAGDYILINVARIMREVCKDCDISRWGGEEFLIYSSGNLRAKGLPMFETLRQRVESEDFVFGEEHIKVTITSGMAEYTSDSSVDKWVNAADNNLYTGKKTGKNKVVY